MTVDAHARAVLDLLDAVDDNPPLVVYDGAVPKDSTTGKSKPPPYVLVYVAVLTPSGEMPADSTSLDMDSDRVVLRAYCHSVGANGQAARMVADRVRAALLGVTPTIAGRDCWPIRHDEGLPADRDESTGLLVMDQVDVYRLESVPA
ncbi:hypothetical protein ACFUYE_05355 [Micromonospora humida]|uniref:hypothetical protein n=1 Tax=Micromonospora humida TaxID=2809018 RepID=UPI00366C43C9